jgi:hypothetical protein
VLASVDLVADANANAKALADSFVELSFKIEHITGPRLAHPITTLVSYVEYFGWFTNGAPGTKHSATSHRPSTKLPGIADKTITSKRGGPKPT